MTTGRGRTSVPQRYPVRGGRVRVPSAGWGVGLAVALLLPGLPSAAQDPTELNNRGVREAQAGRFQEAVELLRQTLELVPTDLQAKKNLSGVLTDWAVQLQEKGRFDQATAALQEAHQHDPANAKALLLLGDLAYTTQDDLAAAVFLWKNALPGVSAHHRKGVLERISQAQRDLAIEKGFQPVRTAHFQIRFERSQDPGATDLLARVLEEEYSRLKRELGSAPSRLAVIVYAEGSFKRIAGRQDWTFGLYDGRIRLRLEDMETDRMAPILSHELAHAFLKEMFGPRVPVWVHEGFAQAHEPSREMTPRERDLLQGVTSGTGWVPLKWLDRRFQQPSNLEDVERAYAQSKWVVSKLVGRFGMPKFRQFLNGLRSGKPVDQAFERAFKPLSWGRADQGHLDESPP